MNERRFSYDIAVVGAGSAGISAAIGAAKAGTKVALVDRSAFLGGQATNCTIPSYCGFYTQDGTKRRVAGGMVDSLLDIFARIGTWHQPVVSPSGNVLLPIDPESVKYALDECLAATDVTAYLETSVIGCSVADSRIESIACVDDEGPFVIEAQAFVDASGEANLAQMAGAGMISYENVNLQIATMVMRIGGVDAAVKVSKQHLEAAIASGKLQGIAPFSKETGYIARMPVSNHLVVVLASEQLSDLAADKLTAAASYTRKQCWAYLEAFRKFIPGFESAYLVGTGPRLGIRESRHLRGEYVLSKDDVLEARKFADSIGQGAWPIEVHASISEPSRYQNIHDKTYYDIPLRTLKSANISNLWGGGRIVSCDRHAFGSVRVMGTAFITGHGAGVAAALTLNRPHYDTARIQAELRRQGAIL